MLKKILPAVSYIFHPIFITLYATIFYLFSNNSTFINQEKIFIIAQIAIITVVVPMLFFFVLKSTKIINSYKVLSVGERKIPLIIHCFLLILILKKTITIERYTELHFYILGALTSTIIALMIAFLKRRVSLHMIGISSLTIFIIGLNLHDQVPYTIAIALLILMNGIIASSRLALGNHSERQLIVGTLIGALPQMLLLYLWL